MDSLRKHAHVLKTMSTLKPQALKEIINTANPGLIRVLCDVCHNILRGHVKLTPLQEKRLKSHRHSIRALTVKGGLKKKKKILQKGGLIGALLKPIVGLLGAFLRN